MAGTGPATVGILIFDEVEVLDFCGPFEVLASARASGSEGDEGRLFHVLTIAERSEVVRCRGGLLVQPHHTIRDHPPLDVLVVPGGRGTRRERENEILLDWIVEQDRRTALTTSVCTGAFLPGCRGPPRRPSSDDPLGEPRLAPQPPSGRRRPRRRARRRRGAAGYLRGRLRRD